MKLADLDPEALGADAAARVLHTLSRLAAPLSPVRLDVAGAAAESGLAWTVADLCRWAQTGALGDWTDHHDAGDALLTVGEALWSRPIDATDAGHGWTVDDLRSALAGDSEPDDALRYLLGCAVARWALCEGDVVTCAELAALGGVSVQRVQQLAGDLAGTVVQRGSQRVTVIPAVTARRWLAARGAPGWRA